MLLHTAPSFYIYFGDAGDSLYLPDIQRFKAKNLLEYEPFIQLKYYMPMRDLFISHQVHGTDGSIVDYPHSADFLSLSTPGDFLITKDPIGIGVLTADCLPIIFHDRLHNVIAIAHAGWRGSVKEIAIKTIDRMREEYGTHHDDLRIIFGPSSKGCCYEVSEDFVGNLAPFAFAPQTMHRRADALYFDVPTFNALLLEEHGIKREAILLDYNTCTMCDHSFFSHRRQGEKAGRQMTVVCLK